MFLGDVRRTRNLPSAEVVRIAKTEKIAVVTALVLASSGLSMRSLLILVPVSVSVASVGVSAGIWYSSALGRIDYDHLSEAYPCWS